MPQLASQLLRRKFGNSPNDLNDLYIALQRGGDNDLLKSNGRGGLGRAFNSQLAKEAFHIDTSVGKTGKTVQMQARDIEKLWQLAEIFKEGDGGNFNKNCNKQIICLVFIILQQTTPSSFPWQEKAYNELLNDIYGANLNYKDQLLVPENKNGVTVRQKIEEMYKDFVKAKKQLSPLQKSTTITAPVSADYPTPVNRPSHYSRNSFSEIHIPLNNGNLSPMPIGYYSAHSPQSASSGSRSTSAPAELQEVKPAMPEEVPPAETLTVENFLHEMVRNTTASDYLLTMSQIKVAQMVYFIVHIDDLTLLQLSELCHLMYNIQAHVLQNEKRFDTVRTESFFIRRWFAPIGNTATWQKMGQHVQDVMLTKLTLTEVKNLHPDYTDEQIDKEDLTRLEKIPLAQDVYQNYHRLFKTSFSRNTSSVPAVFYQYCNRFIDRHPNTLRRR